MTPTSFELAAPELALLRALRGIRYGSIEAVVHAGRIVHYECRERVRFSESERAAAPDADPTSGGIAESEPDAERPERRKSSSRNSRGAG